MRSLEDEKQAFQQLAEREKAVLLAQTESLYSQLEEVICMACPGL